MGVQGSVPIKREEVIIGKVQVTLEQDYLIKSKAYRQIRQLESSFSPDASKLLKALSKEGTSSWIKHFFI